jgi:hypothetical protein
MSTTRRKSDLTAARLRELLNYDQTTGVFRWRVATARRIVVGDIAGGPDHAYWVIWIDGKKYGAHCLAWLHVHGEWPPGDIDHKDTVKHHNWIDNLRPATRSQNVANTARRRSNSSGYKGVSANGGKWMARIRKGGRLLYLGSFATREEAHAAYISRAGELFGDFANSG